MKKPSECADLLDVRVGIDSLDRQIIECLGLRMQYVKAASQFKPSLHSIPAPDRVARMLPERRAWALEAGLDADYVEQLFAGIIDWYIHQQIDYWQSKQQSPKS
ncbi:MULTISPECIES: isochorismate lyase [Pseudomonas]|uniref:Isochorismate pyruvate lyase n=1 Tax=Pseudomonas hunanensis TaxID=1247546 RepID=A0ACC6K9V7_9PSED|nr:MULTISPECIES: isochorismate lyase [Pseudomonas]MBP2261349.1 isochorismate pyruvate lyase [Pseudomonas sp. BP8]MDR6715181.1 isochorismate pyruvate lyase [Pseudomonas hunanensis]HDS1734547.1 isochorismate lyase [Pseudomonas putida]